MALNFWRVLSLNYQKFKDIDLELGDFGMNGIFGWETVGRAVSLFATTLILDILHRNSISAFGR